MDQKAIMDKMVLQEIEVQWDQEDSLVPQVHLDYWGLLAPRDHWVSKGPRETRETLAAPELTVAMDKMEQQDPPVLKVNLVKMEQKEM